MKSETSVQTKFASPGYYTIPELKQTYDLWWNKLRSEEHTSELQSRTNLVCRLLLEKKKNKKTTQKQKQTKNKYK